MHHKSRYAGKMPSSFLIITISGHKCLKYFGSLAFLGALLFFFFFFLGGKKKFLCGGNVIFRVYFNVSEKFSSA